MTRWTGTSTTSHSTNILSARFTIYAVDSATGRQSNAIVQTVTAKASCLENRDEWLGGKRYATSSPGVSRFAGLGRLPKETTLTLQPGAPASTTATPVPVEGRLLICELSNDPGEFRSFLLEGDPLPSARPQDHPSAFYCQRAAALHRLHVEMEERSGTTLRYLKHMWNAACDYMRSRREEERS